MSIDEAMVKYKGRVFFWQYMPKKPTKWGIKVRMLAESKTSYVSNFDVFLGRAPPSGQAELGMWCLTSTDLSITYIAIYTSIIFLTLQCCWRSCWRLVRTVMAHWGQTDIPDLTKLADLASSFVLGRFGSFRRGTWLPLFGLTSARWPSYQRTASLMRKSQSNDEQKNLHIWRRLTFQHQLPYTINTWVEWTWVTRWGHTTHQVVQAKSGGGIYSGSCWMSLSATHLSWNASPCMPHLPEVGGHCSTSSLSWPSNWLEGSVAGSDILEGRGRLHPMTMQ